MANRKENAEERQFRKELTEYINEVGVGVLYPGYDGRTDIVRHHVLGKSAKHNKKHIGYYFIIAIPEELHADNNHPLNVTYHKKAFVKVYGRQCHIYDNQIRGMLAYGYKIPPADIISAIMGTSA